MTTSQKAALSLLISVLLFGAFTALTYTGLFDLIETRFYNPSITNSLTRDISRNAEAIDNFLIQLQTRFSGTLKDSAVRHSFLPDQNAEDIYERSRIYGLLMESIDGLQGIRFIDSGGARIHYSTYGNDVLLQDRSSVSYRNYSETEYPYEKIAVNDGGAPKYILDEKMDRILFSIPFNDSFEVYRGTALFSLSVRAVSDWLINEGRIKAGQDISIISNPPGFLSGMSTLTEKAVSSEVSTIWNEGGTKLTRLTSPDSNMSLALISVKTTQGFYVGRLINEEVFSFPQTMKIILLASFFITVYLTIFLIFNIRQDSVTIVQNRLKQLQISLIEQYYERKSDVDWSRWSRELEQRREEISKQLKRGIKTASGGKKGDIDTLVDKSWDELLTVIGGRKDSSIDEEKLQVILNRILAALPGNVAPIQISNQPSSVMPSTTQDGAVEEAEPLDELEEIEEAVEAAEELTEEAEPLDELEEIEEAVEAAEELTEEAEPLDELEEIEEAAEELTEEAEPLDELEEIEEAVEAAEELTEEAEPLDELEEIEDSEIREETADVPALELDAEVPVIDMAEMNLSADLADEVTQIFGMEEDAVELEELGEEEDTEEPQNTPPDDPGINIDNLASQIEFSPIIEQDKTEDYKLHDDFEIVSPFATILFDFSTNSDEGYLQPAGEESLAEEIPEEISDSPVLSTGKVSEDEGSPTEEMEYLAPAEEETSEKTGLDDNSTDAALEEDENISDGISVIYKPFYESTGDKDIETLEALPGDDGNNEEECADIVDIIEEREGIHYISKDVLNTETESNANLDRDFKNLVDSIIK